MRKFIGISIIAVSVSACAVPTRQPVTGILYSDTKATENVTDNSAAPKTGEACMQSILGVATGDASMDAARRLAVSPRFLTSITPQKAYLEYGLSIAGRSRQVIERLAVQPLTKTGARLFLSRAASN